MMNSGTRKRFDWVKLGKVYAPSGLHAFDQTHCHKPTPVLIDTETIRLYFGTRDSSGRTRTTFVDLDADNPLRVKYVHNQPVIDLGKLGAFDDSGANVSSVIRVGNALYMYYIGWNPSTTVHTRNAIGLAISIDNGLTFRRAYDGSILDRTKDEPYYTGAVDVVQDSGKFRIWYTSGSEWKVINNKPEIFYHIKYAESCDGIDWERDNVSCITPMHEFEAVARPAVLNINGEYHMWYSKRDLRSFRDNPHFGYRGGYATSSDGISWLRQDEEFGLALSDDGWDSKAIAYPYILNQGNRLLMFYNGNSFGLTGFGVAECRI